MIALPGGVRVWLATGRTDMRKGFDGLAVLVQETLRHDPHGGNLFVFRGRRGDMIKLLWFDGQGLVLLAKRLEQAGLRTKITREPGGSPGAEIIRHLLLSGIGSLIGGAQAETLLFAAARDDHVQTVIAPALAQGTWVLCDRFSDSTRAYQGRLGEVAPALLNALATSTEMVPSAACQSANMANRTRPDKAIDTPTGTWMAISPSMMAMPASKTKIGLSAMFAPGR